MSDLKKIERKYAHYTEIFGCLTPGRQGEPCPISKKVGKKRIKWNGRSQKKSEKWDKKSKKMLDTQIREKIKIANTTTNTQNYIQKKETNFESEKKMKSDFRKKSRKD